MTMHNHEFMVHNFVEVESGRIAYETTGEGPSLVLAPGMADTRATYRFLAPLLVDAGFCVTVVDLRGHGESSVEWPSYSRTDTAHDLLAVVDALGRPAVVVGQSFSGGSATIAAALRPEVVRAVVEIAPFTRPPRFSIGALLSNHHDYRRGAVRLGTFAVTGRVKHWRRYLDVAYPGTKPHDWDTWLTALEANLEEPGRVAAVRAMIRSTPVDAAAALPQVRRPALVLMGTLDSDFADPEAEAAAIVDALPDGIGSYTMVAGAGHYPHAQFPEEVAAAIISFVRGLPDA
jgi:pimeloyl-ACP methyl ester carboxylesterase